MVGRIIAFGLAASCVCAADPLSALTDFTSPELRAQRNRLASLRAKLNRLPPQPSDQSTERIGWHSRLSGDAHAPHSITADLGADAEFDAVVLVPANVPIGSHPGPGYGFPVRFRVEVLDEDPTSLPVTLADFTSSDFPQPGNLPVAIETPGARGRFVRVTATRSFIRDGIALFALGELMVLRGSQNLAAGAAVRVSDNYANAPAWQPENATDGQGVLGPPLRIEPAPGNGFHSTIAKDAATTKWVQLDLGRAQAIDEVRLHAARPKDFPPRRGFGFPPRFRVEASASADFAQPATLAGWTEHDFPNPGENPVTIAARGVEARFVRMTATRLWERNDDFIFALAEMEVFAGGENVARGASVQASDNLEEGSWSAVHLNDGFTSQGRLVDFAGWLRDLSRRRELLLDVDALDRSLAPLVRKAQQRLAWSASGAAAIGVMVVAWLVVARRRRHQHELTRLRQRIAADLHDEIGSNLGSIALLARLAADQRDADPRADLADIHRIARETAESMRDIVWLIQPGPRAVADMIARMREVAAQLLAEVEWSFEADEVGGPFSLEFERQVFLLYKEALNNIRRHARARRVAIRVEQQGGEFVLRIVDDGAGFDPAHASAGHGLASMRQRAGLIGGRLEIRSQPAQGTQLELHVRPA